MSEYFYHPLSAAQSSAYPEFPQYFDKQEYAPKQLSPNDFDTFIGTTNVSTLSVEQFENDLDTHLATWNIDAELQLLPTDTSDLFRRIRTETPTRGGPSTIHSESASGYDTGYTESAYDPAYGSTYGSTYNQSDASAYSEIDMNLQALGLANREDGQYMPSPISPIPSGGVGLSAPNYSPASSYHRGSFSDYEPQTHMRAPSSSSSDYYPHSPLSGMGKYTTSVVQATVSPANVSTQLPSVHSVMTSQRAVKSENVNRDIPKDPKRKYTCPSCPRAFARAFNLKTHIQTHDPHRAKPYICHHKTCGRSFSRKHDLTRHLVSIHRSEAEENVKEGNSIGIASGNRVRCDTCGTSWVNNGKAKGCDCDDIK